MADNHKNNIPELITALKNIYKFAKSFKEECVNSFAPWFKTSYRWLRSKRIKDNENIKIKLPLIYDDAQIPIKAIFKSFVFGGMGWWNDSAKGVAELHKKSDIYNKLTNDLYFNLIKAYCYCINKMDGFTVRYGAYPINTQTKVND